MIWRIRDHRLSSDRKYQNFERQATTPEVMTEPTDISGPTPLPGIPRTPLWIAFSIPPLAILAGNLIVSFDQNPDPYGSSYLWVPIVVFFVILGFLPVFHRVMKTRYRGRSLVFLNFAYFFGQIIICLSLWAGSCLLFMK
jgi:hypothetical protein